MSSSKKISATTMVEFSPFRTVKEMVGYRPVEARRNESESTTHRQQQQHYHSGISGGGGGGGVGSGEDGGYHEPPAGQLTILEVNEGGKHACVEFSPYMKKVVGGHPVEAHRNESESTEDLIIVSDSIDATIEAVCAGSREGNTSSASSTFFSTTTSSSSSSSSSSGLGADVISSANSSTNSGNGNNMSDQNYHHQLQLQALTDRLLEAPPLEAGGWEEKARLIDHYHNTHSDTWKNALFDVLVEMKANFAATKAGELKSAQKRLDNQLRDEVMQQSKLTNLLAREGVLTAEGCAALNNESRIAVAVHGGKRMEVIERNYQPVIDLTDQKELERVSSFRDLFYEELAKCRNECGNAVLQMEGILAEQGYIRPITPKDAEKCVEGVRNKFLKLEGELKLATCQMTLATRSQAAEMKHKRRNFPKNSTDILNDYFYAHLDAQYPSESVKRELAVRCQMTIYQVSNWFGNKRTRFKRNGKKVLRERNLYGVVPMLAGVEKRGKNLVVVKKELNKNAAERTVVKMETGNELNLPALPHSF